MPGTDGRRYVARRGYAALHGVTQSETARQSGPFACLVRAGRQLTLTALHAAATALYCGEPLPYRSAAAFRVAVRAAA